MKSGISNKYPFSLATSYIRQSDLPTRETFLSFFFAAKAIVLNLATLEAKQATPIFLSNLENKLVKLSNKPPSEPVVPDICAFVEAQTIAVTPRLDKRFNASKSPGWPT